MSRCKQLVERFNKVNEMIRPSEFPIELGNFKVSTIGSKEIDPDGGILWVTDKHGQFKDYYHMGLSTKKEEPGRDYSELSVADQKKVVSLFKKGKAVIDETPRIQDVAKELKAAKIGLGDFKIELEPLEKNEQVIFFKIVSKENSVKESFYLSVERGELEGQIQHNTYTYGKDISDGIIAFINDVKEKVLSKYFGGDPKSTLKDAKELLMLLKPISSSLIDATNKLSNIYGNWSGDGSRWRTMKYSVSPAIKKFVNQLGHMRDGDFHTLVEIEKGLEEIIKKEGK